MPMPVGIKKQAGQTREPTKMTGKRMQYRQKGRPESAAVQRGASRMGRGSKRG